MSYDPMDVGSGAVSSMFRQIRIFAAAVWFGSVIGVTGLLAGIAASGKLRPEMVLMLWKAPVFLLSGWGMFNLLVLLGAFVFFVFSDKAGYLAWIAFAGFESLVVMLGWAGDTGGWFAHLVAWFAWLVTLAMAAVGTFLLRNWRMNRLARELAEIAAENASKRETSGARRFQGQAPPESMIPRVEVPRPGSFNGG